ESEQQTSAKWVVVHAGLRSHQKEGGVGCEYRSVEARPGRSSALLRAVVWPQHSRCYSRQTERRKDRNRRRSRRADRLLPCPRSLRETSPRIRAASSSACTRWTRLG